MNYVPYLNKFEIWKRKGTFSSEFQYALSHCATHGMVKLCSNKIWLQGRNRTLGNFRRASTMTECTVVQWKLVDGIIFARKLSTVWAFRIWLSSVQIRYVWGRGCFNSVCFVTSGKSVRNDLPSSFVAYHWFSLSSYNHSVSNLLPFQAFKSSFIFLRGSIAISLPACKFVEIQKHAANYSIKLSVKDINPLALPSMKKLMVSMFWYYL